MPEESQLEFKNSVFTSHRDMPVLITSEVEFANPKAHQARRNFEDEDRKEAKQISARHKMVQACRETSDKLVLVVDDCPFNVVAVQSLIEQFDHASEYCTNGNSAFEVVKGRLERG